MCSFLFFLKLTLSDLDGRLAPVSFDAIRIDFVGGLLVSYTVTYVGQIDEGHVEIGRQLTKRLNKRQLQ